MFYNNNNKIFWYRVVLKIMCSFEIKKEFKLRIQSVNCRTYEIGWSARARAGTIFEKSENVFLMHNWLTLSLSAFLSIQLLWFCSVFCFFLFASHTAYASATQYYNSKLFRSANECDRSDKNNHHHQNQNRRVKVHGIFLFFCSRVLHTICVQLVSSELAFDPNRFHIQYLTHFCGFINFLSCAIHANVASCTHNMICMCGVRCCVYISVHLFFC